MIPYANPILDSDFPDPDVTRFGDSFVMVASSFNRTPGLPILVSDDLVNWRYASHALAAVPPAEGHFDLPRRGGGVWAPSIRTSSGRLVVVYPDPDHGIFVTTAPCPQGPWTPPHLLIAGQGLIDPCPLWDADGRAYLVFGWARSRAGFKNRLSVVEVDPALTAPVGPIATVIDGDAIEGMVTLEGPKFYARDGWYWIFAPAGGVATGHQVVFRSRSVWGPYEHRVVLEQGQTPVNGPHQGGWVEAPDGSHWFVHFQDRDAFGRVVHLQPMGWGDDGWPWMGEGGQPVLTWPAGVPTPPASAGEPDRSDDFAVGLNPAWHWQATPRDGWAEAAGGTLSLEGSWASSAAPGPTAPSSSPAPSWAPSRWTPPFPPAGRSRSASFPTAPGRSRSRRAGTASSSPRSASGPPRRTGSARTCACSPSARSAPPTAPAPGSATGGSPAPDPHPPTTSA